MALMSLTMDTFHSSLFFSALVLQRRPDGSLSTGLLLLQASSTNSDSRSHGVVIGGLWR